MSHKLNIPASFSVVNKGDTTLFVKERYKEIINQTIFDKESFHNKDKNNINVKFGRGRYLSVSLTENNITKHDSNQISSPSEGKREGEVKNLDKKKKFLQNNNVERFIIRNYRHGGLFGKLFGGIFYNGNRPLNEIYINEIAYQKGVPSAEVIAITKKKIWGFFYKADFITKEISDAVDITQFLKESSLQFIQKSKKSTIFALVKLIRKMHDAGIYHADLHLKNILLKKGLNGDFSAYVIDLDKSVVLNNLNINQRIKNLLRLDRSLEKLRWLSSVITIPQSGIRNYENTPPLFLHLQGRKRKGGKNFSPDENYQSNLLVSQSNIFGEVEKNVSLDQKLNLISRTDRIRFFKSYILYGNALDKDWKIYVRKYQSSHSMHKLWWRLLYFFSKRS